MSKGGKGTFHVLKNFQKMAYRSPWWVLDKFLNKSEGESLRSRLKEKDYWKEGKN